MGEGYAAGRLDAGGILLSGTELEYSERQAVVGAARARLYLILTAVGYSTMGAAFKFVDWNPLVISAAEKMFAFFCLGIARGSFKMRFSRPVLLGAVCSYACTTCFVAANKLTTAANAIVLQYTNPMFVVLLSWLVLRRRGCNAEISCSRPCLWEESRFSSWTSCRPDIWWAICLHCAAGY